MLIRGGLIHTMTAQGTLVGDILIRDGRIVQVGGRIEVPEEPCILEAGGLTILPGLIDAHIHDGPEMDAGLLRSEQAAGVTSGLLWPEKEDLCSIVSADAKEASTICAIQPAAYTDAQLYNRFLSLAQEGLRPACKIGSSQECRWVLQVVHSTRVKAIMLDLSGCEDMLEAVALACCPVIIGVDSRSTDSPWSMAKKLDAMGVQVALTCSHPNAKLRHLPLCAALCVRDGMDRERALRTVTEAPAAILKLTDAGRIASGCRADFAIYDGDPLLLATSHVMTIAGGKIRH